jgi:fucose permease
MFARGLARDWTAGFLLLGILIAVPGPLTVAWRYQLDNDPRAVALHFLALNGTLLVVACACHVLRHRLPSRSLFIGACLLAFAGLLSFTFSLPPVRVEWRIAGMGVLGASAGILLVALLSVIRPDYEERGISALSSSGGLCGFGCLLVTAAMGGAYSLHSVQWESALVALLPLIILVLYLRPESRRLRTTARAGDQGLRGALDDLRSVAAVLFGLLLFFQFGNEWSLADWLPLFLIHRLGASPDSAIFVLALYFASLLAGRFFVQLLLTRVSHSRLLIGSVLGAMLGYLLLSQTNSVTGAALATVLTGMSFAPIYAVTAEKIGWRFDGRPDLYNGIFLLAVIGGVLAPWLLGYVGYYLGMNYIMLMPAVGSAAVLVLMACITLESKLMRGNAGGPPSTPNASSKTASAGSNS